MPANMNDNAASSDPHIWMIRTSDNVLSGPYTQDQLIQLVEEEKLELTDEICRGNSYWIYLHEEQEVKKHLGIEVPAALVEPEEPTQTETDSIIRRSEPSHQAHQAHQAAAAMGARAQRSSTVSPEQHKAEAAKVEYTPVVEPIDDEEEEDPSDVPELSVSADSIEDHTAVLNNRAFREFRPREQTPPAATAAVAATEAIPQPQTVPTAAISPTPEVQGFTVEEASANAAKTRFWIIAAVVVVGIATIWFAWQRLRS
jgi:hypothetical protein